MTPGTRRSRTALLSIAVLVPVGAVVVIARADQPGAGVLLASPPPATRVAVGGDGRAESRSEVAQLLREHGASAPVAAGLATTATWGVLLRDGGTGRSRLGGRPLVPAGTRWPRGTHGLMAHLATIDLDELPDFRGRGLLPDHGTLAFFLDTAARSGLRSGHDAGAVRVILTPRGRRTVAPAVPQRAPRALTARRVRFVPRLQVEAPPAGSAVRAFAAGLNGVEGTDAARQQLLGNPWAGVDNPTRGPAVSLLHLALRGTRVVTVSGDRADVRAARWDRLTWSLVKD